MPKLTANMQKIIQGLSVAVAVGTQFGPAIPEGKIKTTVVLGTTALAAIVGIMGQYTNPDGSKAQTMWDPEKGRVPIPEDER